MEQTDDVLAAAPTYFCLGALVIHWTSPARQSLNYLQKAFDCAQRMGDHLYGGYVLYAATEIRYSMGVPCSELEKILTQDERYARATNNEFLLRSISMFRDHINTLARPTSSAEDGQVMKVDADSLEPNQAMMYHLLQVQRLYLKGELEEAFKLIENSIRRLDLVAGSIIEVDYVFYFLLIAWEILKKQRGKVSLPLRRQCRDYKERLKKWAKLSPENHGGKYLLVDALWQTPDKQYRARQLFDEAIRHAEEQQNILLAALANYLAARYHGDGGKIAAVYAQDAYRLFLQWGADQVAERIANMYGLSPELVWWEIGVTNSSSSAQAEPRVHAFNDLHSDLEVLPLDAAYRCFLDRICGELGLDFGAILLARDASLKLDYVWTPEGSASRLLSAKDQEEYERYLPHKVVRYASRTLEEVIVGTKPEGGPFANDNLLRERSSISFVCLPVVFNHVFAGLVYLESRHNGHFDQAMVEHIRHQSFYLLMKQMLEGEKASSEGVFVAQSVKDRLTRRELEVLNFMARGMSNTEIAERLYISSSTVKTHTLNLYSKLEVKNRVQAIAKARSIGLLDSKGLS